MVGMALRHVVVDKLLFLNWYVVRVTGGLVVLYNTAPNKEPGLIPGSVNLHFTTWQIDVYDLG